MWWELSKFPTSLMKAAKGSEEWQNYLAFMAFESTFINVFQGGDRLQNNFPTAEQLSPWAPSSHRAPWKGKDMHPQITCEQETFPERSQNFSHRVRISTVPEKKNVNFPNAMTSTQLIDLDWNTISLSVACICQELPRGVKFTRLLHGLTHTL